VIVRDLTEGEEENEEGEGRDQQRSEGGEGRSRGDFSFDWTILKVGGVLIDKLGERLLTVELILCKVGEVLRSAVDEAREMESGGRVGIGERHLGSWSAVLRECEAL